MITAAFALGSHKDYAGLRDRIELEIRAAMTERCSVEIRLLENEKRFLTHILRELRNNGFRVQDLRRNVISGKAMNDAEFREVSTSDAYGRLYYIALSIGWFDQ